MSRFCCSFVSSLCLIYPGIRCFLQKRMHPNYVTMFTINVMLTTMCFCVTASAAGSKERQQTTPTSSRSTAGQVRPRTLPLDRSAGGGRSTPTGGRTTPSETSSRGSGQYTKKEAPRAPVASHRKTSRYSAPLTASKDDTEPVLRRSSMGSTLNKAHSKSLHSLNMEEEDDLTPRGTNRRTRPKWDKATPRLSTFSTFASVPNLLQPDNDGKLSVKSSDDSCSVDSSRSEPDVNDNIIKKAPVIDVKPASKTTDKSTNGRTSDSSSRRSVSSRYMRSSSSSSNIEDCKKASSRNVSASASMLNLSGKSGKDRDLMPPPAVPSTRTRGEKTVKRGDPRRRTTDNSGFSLEEAKEILSGKSSKIVEIKEKAQRRSTSISPSRTALNNPSVPSVKDSKDFISSNILKTAAEIEKTAAELRRKSGASDISLEASPNDPPVRDVPAERDLSRTSVVSSEQRAKVTVKPLVESVKTRSDSGASSPRLSDISNDSEEGCASPSVKERIARLNQHVGEPGRQSSSSRDRARTQSPVHSPRQTSTVQVNLTASLNSVATPPHVSKSVSQPDNTLSPLSSSGKPTVTCVPSPRALPVVVAGPQASPPANSTHEEGVMDQLSPHHSNSSPRSVTDTGLGSDTDLDSRYVHI